MQTFMPRPSFAESARDLDRQRLGKQRVETMQIMSALLVPGAGWSRHPAALMWKGYEAALLKYQYDICREWTHWRGYKDTCLEKTKVIYEQYADADAETIMPPWNSDPSFHRSHQSNLIRKLPEHYGPLYPGVPDDLPYIWPEAS